MTQDFGEIAAWTVGDNAVRLWGMTIEERNARIARASGIAVRAAGGAAAGAIAREAGPGATVLSNAGYAFDPAWWRHLLANPGMVLSLGGVPVLAHARTPDETARITRSMESGSPMEPLSLGGEGAFTILRFEDGPTIENKSLRKRETPFVLPLRTETVRQIERASYFGAYKGVTDILTKYLWPEWALVLTRICAALHITPNMVTFAGAVFCVIATVLFAQGHYWWGMATGLVFMVFDTVDGKLARCTITSSAWGNVFDHGMDLIHPPFWWWFWATGLVAWNLSFDHATFWWVQAAIQLGYWVQRAIEGVFMRWNGGMHIHVWRRFDSRFRLVTARRNPNMVILFVATLFQRPDIGLIAVAWWTVISCLVHAVRLGQAWVLRQRGIGLVSWLSDEGEQMERAA